MPTAPFVFRSHGIELSGDLSLPDADRPVPAVVLVHALSGKRWTPERVLPASLVRAGIAGLSFDWRGFVPGADDGMVLPSRIAADVVAAVEALAGHESVAASAIGVLGRGFGAGPAILSAAGSQRVQTVAAVCGFGDFRRRTGLVRGADDLAALEAELASAAPTEPVPLDRFLPPRGERPHPSAPPGVFGSVLPARSVTAVLACAPERVVAALAPRPLLVLHPSDDAMFPLAEAERLVAAAGENAELRIVAANDHLDLYPGSGAGPDAVVVDELVSWFGRHLSGRVA